MENYSKATIQTLMQRKISVELGKMENYSKATIQTLMQRKISVELRVSSKGEGILTIVGTKVINWVKGKNTKLIMKQE